MNIKKAIGAGLLAFAIQFAAVNVLSGSIGPLLTGGTWVGYVWQIVMSLVLIAVVYYVSRWYFVGNNANVINGFYLGIIIAVVSVAVTLLQIIPILAGGQAVLQPLLQYVGSLAFWITVALTIVASILAGYLKKRRACNVEGAVGNCMPNSVADSK